MRLVFAVLLVVCKRAPADARVNHTHEGLRQLCPLGHVFDVNRGCIPAAQSEQRRRSPPSPSSPAQSPIAPSSTTRPLGQMNDIAVLQYLLIWTGNYNAMVDGIPGPRTARALDDFLRRHGLGPESTEAAWDALIGEAGGAMGDAGFKIVRDYALDITFGIPNTLLGARPSPDSTRRKFASADGAIELELALLTDRTLDTLYKKLSRKARREIEYEKVTREWFVLTGTDPGRGFYVRYHMIGGAIRGFSISYPIGGTDALGPLVVAMSNVFRPSATARDPLVTFVEGLASAVETVASRDEDWDVCAEAASPDAIVACTRIIEAGNEIPESLANAHFNRGLAYYDREQYGLAAEDFTEAIRLAPSDAEARYYRGLVFSREGEFVRAIADFTDSIKLQPNNADAYFNRGLAYAADVGDYDRAISDYTRVIALKPTYAVAYFARSVAYEAKGELHRALDDMQFVVSTSNPSDPWYNDALSRAAGLETRLAPSPAPRLNSPTTNVSEATQSDCGPQDFGGVGIRVKLTCREVDGNSVTMIVISGDIEPGDDLYFKQALLAARSTPVFVSLTSDGGDLRAGLEIGRAIWISEVRTLVEHGECNSACAIAWLAGRPRYMGASAAIGFHAPWQKVGSRPERSTAGSAVVGGFLRDIGLTSDAIRYINEPGPEEMRYLTLEDAEALNIVVRPWQPDVPATQESRPEVRALQAGLAFRDCASCPEMVVVPAGSFFMGTSDTDAEHQNDEGPRHEVRFESPFAVGRFEVTFTEWDACLADGGCESHRPDDQGWGRGQRPVINVSWNQARSYVAWLSRKTGWSYRLLSEAEWEYVARGGLSTPYATGTSIDRTTANIDGEKTAIVGSYPANGYGLHDINGNVWEWVEDCYAEAYEGAPQDGTAVSPLGCKWRVLRGAGWSTSGKVDARVAFRFRRVPDSTRDSVGFRVARTIAPASQAGVPPDR